MSDLLLSITIVFISGFLLYRLFIKPNNKNTDWSKSPHKLYYDGIETPSLKPKKSRYQQYLEETSLLEEHQKKYFCHICHKPSQGPQRYKNKIFWDKPVGLVKCKKCKQLTCLNHLEYGLCEKCSKSSKK